MRKLILVFLTLFLLASLSFAQKRVEVGIFLDSLDISQTSTNNLGLGARVGFRVHQNVMFEGELAYDYGLNFDEAYRNVITGDITAIKRTSIGVTHDSWPHADPGRRPSSPFRYDESRIH